LRSAKLPGFDPHLLDQVDDREREARREVDVRDQRDLDPCWTRILRISGRASASGLEGT